MIAQRSREGEGVDTGLVLSSEPPGLVSAPGGGASSALVYVASLQSEKSRSTARWALQKAVALLSPPEQPPPPGAWASPAWEAFTVDHLLVLRTRLGETMAPSSGNLVLSMVRGVLRTAWERGRLPHETWARLKAVKGVRGEREPPGRALSLPELARLRAALPPTGKGALVGGILAVTAGGGLRRSEVGRQGLERWAPDVLGGSLLVLGKGNKERRVPLPGEAQGLLRAWLAVRGPEPGPLFPPCDDAGRWLPGRLLTGQAVARLLAGLARAAGVQDFGPHDLRRTYATLLFDRGVDPARIQKLMGHKKLETTLRYDRRGETALQEASAALGLPW